MKTLAPLQSDHSSVFLKFKSFVDRDTRGPGHWKFNNPLVNDATFINEMQDLINKVSSNSRSFMTQGLVLKLSVRIRNFAREYSISKAKERKSRR